jgi:hypothetical protein
MPKPTVDTNVMTLARAGELADRADSRSTTRKPTAIATITTIVATDDGSTPISLARTTSTDIATQLPPMTTRLRSRASPSDAEPAGTACGGKVSRIDVGISPGT